MNERGEPRLAPWRERMHEVIFEADTPAGKAFDVGLLLTIALSVVAVLLESVAPIRREHGMALRTAEWSFTALFTVEYALRLACDYARDRKVFRDTPIGAHQAIQHPLAEVKIRQEAARTMTYKAAWALDAGLPPGEAGFYANCAKFLASELGVQATDRAIQTLGGNGFSKEFGLLHLWTNLRLLKTAPISNEMILNYVAEHTLELPRSY